MSAASEWRAAIDWEMWSSAEEPDCYDDDGKEEEGEDDGASDFVLIRLGVVVVIVVVSHCAMIAWQI